MIETFALVLYFTHVLQKIVTALRASRRPSPQVSPVLVLLTSHVITLHYIKSYLEWPKIHDC